LRSLSFAMLFDLSGSGIRRLSEGQVKASTSIEDDPQSGGIESSSDRRQADEQERDETDQSAHV
jgi:hypothetical protein